MSFFRNELKHRYSLICQIRKAIIDKERYYRFVLGSSME